MTIMKNIMKMKRTQSKEHNVENFLICDVAYKTPYDVKTLRIISDKKDKYIRKFDRTK